MLAQDLARSLDAALIMEDAGMAPDRWQADVLRSTAKKRLMLCGRQCGKSTVAAAKALHTAIYTPGSLTLLVSPTERQSGELHRAVQDMLGRLPDAPRVARESALRLELATESRIIALPGKEGTIRCYSGVELLILDEAARIEDDLIGAIRPMLATTAGGMMALSTPWGRRGWFFETWGHGEGWERTKVLASECPRITPEFLESELRDLGPTMFRQEYECSFEENEQQLFGSELIARAFSAEVMPLWA